MKGIKKSKSGCLVCKRRKKKCDEAKPRCGHCQRLGLECKYGVVLNWVKLQLRAQVHASGAQPTSYHLVNANFTNVGLSYYLLQMSPNCPVRIHNELWTATVAEPCIDPRKTSPEYLFNHYVRNMSKSRSFCGSTDTANEFVSIIVPLCSAELLLTVRPVQRRRHQWAAPDPGHLRPVKPRDLGGADYYHHDFVRRRNSKQHQQKLGQPDEGRVFGVFIAADDADPQLKGTHVCVSLLLTAVRSTRVHIERRHSGTTARLVPLAGDRVLLRERHSGPSFWVLAETTPHHPSDGCVEPCPRNKCHRGVCSCGAVFRYMDHAFGDETENRSGHR
ncbi:hypothetical protein KL905_005011 [Ogataea polymorpha]|nr:hypothetical protein KL906_005164 [Ogataea polymorpha]KAG7915375.1 hypothetical protein KL905_005011 [Ogataea polymorpha]